MLLTVMVEYLVVIPEAFPCTDGVNPFAHNKVTYSMWPIMLTLLNLLPHYRDIGR